MLEIQIEAADENETAVESAEENEVPAEPETDDREISEEDIKKAAGKFIEREQVAKPTSTNMDSTSGSINKTVRGVKKIGRNDPCPCGSGKKYKKCCGANK